MSVENRGWESLELESAMAFCLVQGDELVRYFEGSSRLSRRNYLRRLEIVFHPLHESRPNCNLSFGLGPCRINQVNPGWLRDESWSASLKRWSQINISRNDSSIHQVNHSLVDGLITKRRRGCPVYFFVVVRLSGPPLAELRRPFPHISALA